MMNAPARNLWPLRSKSSSAASIFTSALRKRNAISVLSVVCSTTSVGAAALDAARRLAHPPSAASSAGRASPCRVIGVSFTLRMYCMVQPVSS